MKKVIGVIGTRQRDTPKDFLKTLKAFKKVYKKGDSICSGLCPEGGDRFAVIIADIYRLTQNKIIWHPAEWEEYGKKAGFIRNTYIAKDSDVLIACVSKDRKGGTEDTIKKWNKTHEDKSRLKIV
jgi:hypothetical protein